TLALAVPLFNSAHPGECRDPDSSTTLAHENAGLAENRATTAPYDLGPGIRRDERNKGNCEGRLIACDVDQTRLDNIKPRLRRAGVTAERRLLGPEGQGTSDLAGAADLVFVDAPCSGSGTWRRHPEEIWRLTPERVADLHALQVAILSQAARLVRPGG